VDAKGYVGGVRNSILLDQGREDCFRVDLHGLADGRFVALVRQRKIGFFFVSFELPTRHANRCPRSGPRLRRGDELDRSVLSSSDAAQLGTSALLYTFPTSACFRISESPFAKEVGAAEAAPKGCWSVDSAQANHAGTWSDPKFPRGKTRIGSLCTASTFSVLICISILLTVRCGHNSGS